jgi:hypothetical protein
MGDASGLGWTVSGSKGGLGDLDRGPKNAGEALWLQRGQTGFIGHMWVDMAQLRPRTSRPWILDDRSRFKEPKSDVATTTAPRDPNRNIAGGLQTACYPSGVLAANRSWR